MLAKSGLFVRLGMNYMLLIAIINVSLVILGHEAIAILSISNKMDMLLCQFVYFTLNVLPLEVNPLLL